MALFSKQNVDANPFTGGEVAVLDKHPPLKSKKPMLSPADPMADVHLAEYAALAATVGIAAPDLEIEAFKKFLFENDIPTFDLATVVAYMDDKAAKESKDKCGWEWHPLRERDHIAETTFGVTGARRQRNNNIETTPASDHYRGPRTHNTFDQHNQPMGMWTHPGLSTYDKTIPLHALRKVALIDKTFGDKVSLFVCDYALAPQIQNPDPFLMAVVNNPKLEIGVGRFVIDFWDEPGFGIAQMVK